MGEFERSGMGVKRGVVWAIEDVFTLANFEIAVTPGIIGYVVFEFLLLFRLFCSAADLHFDF
jgi:hypothetical protein